MTQDRVILYVWFGHGMVWYGGNTYLMYGFQHHDSPKVHDLARTQDMATCGQQQVLSAVPQLSVGPSSPTMS